MNQLLPDIRMVHHIRINDLASYLLRQDWTSVTSPNPRLLVFNGPPDDYGDPLQIVIPSSDEYADAPARIADAINLLAIVEDKSVRDIVVSISISNRDLLRMRILDGDAELLPVSVVAGVVQGMRSLLIAAANNEARRRPYVPQKHTVGQQYAQECLFGHTFPGSFGFTIESPLGLTIDDDAQETFGRHTIERIMRGLHDAQVAADRQQADIVVENHRDGLNANMCSALLEMLIKDQNLSIEYSVGWSPEMQVSSDVQNLTQIRLTAETVPVLKDAYTKLRSMGQNRPVQVVGKIRQLRTDEPLQNDQGQQLQGIDRIVVAWYDTRLKRIINVHVPLPPGDYRVACDAHRDKLDVSVSGDLEKIGRYWLLSSPHNFSVLG